MPEPDRIYLTHPEPGSIPGQTPTANETMKNMTPAEESARFEKLSRELNAAIYALVGQFAQDIGKSPADVMEIGSKIADAGVTACMMKLDEIQP